MTQQKLIKWNCDEINDGKDVTGSFDRKIINFPIRYEAEKILARQVTATYSVKKEFVWKIAIAYLVS